MPLDPSIILGIKPAQDPLQSYGNALAVANQVNQNKLAQLQFQQAEREQARQNKLSELLSAQYATPDAREEALMRGGFVDQSLKLGKDRREGVKLDNESMKAQREAEAAQFKLAHDKTTAMLQYLSSATDQASYDVARQNAANLGLDISKAPAQFDPAYVASVGQQAMTMKDRLEAAARARGLDLQQLNIETVDKRTREEGAANRAVTMRGQNMTDARAREKNNIDREAIGKVDWKQDTDGNWIALPKDVKTNQPVTPVTTTAPGKRQVQAKNALGIINEAEGLIDKATNSYLGAGVDQGARIFGKSTPGADASAQLKALEGALMMAQPRMEGPQSDKDVALYRQMAAQIGDPTVPASQKKAALATVKKLHERYAGQGQGVQSLPGAPVRNQSTGNGASVSNW